MIFFVSIWNDELVPNDVRDATIVLLFKNKGNRADCGGYNRGISLRSVAENSGTYHPEQVNFQHL